jgi:transcriptional regulator with XRE-family HTH domain
LGREVSSDLARSAQPSNWIDLDRAALQTIDDLPHELAARTGIEAQRIRDLEMGQLDPDYEMLIELADGSAQALAGSPDERDALRPVR